MDILTGKERVALNKLLGHGGFFKTKGVGQRLMAGALNVPVAVMESAGEGGAWGIALLASYLANKTGTLEDYLDRVVFAGNAGTTVTPDERDRDGFLKYMERYEAGLAVQRAAVESL
jgi:sugar (pentulose or hexulose) kinase